MKMYAVGTHYNRLADPIPMGTHNMRFTRRKTTFFLNTFRLKKHIICSYEVNYLEPRVTLNMHLGSNKSPYQKEPS